MSDVTTYVGEFHREGDVWEAQARDIAGAHTFGKTLTAARDYLREAIAVWLDVPLDSVIVTVTVPFASHGTDNAVRVATQARQDAERAARTAQESLIDAVLALVNEDGLSYRDAAAVLGVSHQRVNQVMGEARRRAS